MIIYGTNAKETKVSPPNLICPGCETQGSTEFSIYNKYAYLYWIPVFPTGKESVAQCAACKQTTGVNEMAPNVRHAFDKVNEEAKTPIYHFTGAAIIGLLIIAGVYTSMTNSQDNLEYISNPIQGDVYEYETETSNYSTYKVIAVSDDSIYITPNDYEVNKKSGIDEIDIDSNYPDLYFSLSKSELSQMYSDGDIYEVNRD